jgi:hypothetical protein
MSQLGRLVLTTVTLCCLTAGCSGTSSNSPSGTAERILTPAYEKLGDNFGDLVVARDYQGAYGYIAESSRSEIPYSEFEDAFKAYRDSMDETLTVKVVPGDPYQKTDPDALLPDAVRERVEDEFAIEFELEGSEEGFSAIVWVLMEGGQAKIAHFFVGD